MGGLLNFRQAVMSVSRWPDRRQVAFPILHTLSGYVVSGGIELPVEGQPTRMLKAGDGFQVPVATPHAGAKNGDTKTVVVSTYVVEKGKPLASPA